MTSHPEWCYAHFLRPALRVLASYQITPVDVLAGTGLDDSVLRRPYQVITPTQLAQFYSNVLNLNLSPGLALEIGQDIGLADKSALGHAQLAAHQPPVCNEWMSTAKILHHYWFAHLAQHTYFALILKQM